MYGQRGGWYRRLRANPDGDVHDQVHTHPVHAKPVTEPVTVDAVTRANATKDANSSSVSWLLSQEAADATLRLQVGRLEHGEVIADRLRAMFSPRAHGASGRSAR
jgi:hypothetical protein